MYAPSTLSPSIKQNPLYIEGGFTNPSNEPYRNNFVPFQTSKAQFYGLYHLSRTVSTLARALHWVVCGQEEEKKNGSRLVAFAVGDALGDAYELWIMHQRYCRTGRGLLFWKLVSAFFYLRILLLDRRALVGAGTALVGLQTLGNLLPLWWFIFTKQRSRARIAATINAIGLLVASYYAVQEIRRSVEQQRQQTHLQETEAAERRLAIALLAISTLYSSGRAVHLLRFAVAQQKK